MSGEHPKQKSEADAELEREIRAERKFTLEEAIGRMAGPGSMKGVSPISGRQQAVAVIQEYLNRHLMDAAGILPGVLLRRVQNSQFLLNGFDQPLEVLAEYTQRVLKSEYGLKELVREADVEWGRAYEERPHFEKDGSLPHADDPYTIESVRTALTQLAGKLAAGEA